MPDTPPTGEIDPTPAAAHAGRVVLDDEAIRRSLKRIEIVEIADSWESHDCHNQISVVRLSIHSMI